MTATYFVITLFCRGFITCPGLPMTNKKKHPPTPFKGGTLFVIFACLMPSLGSTNDKPSFCPSSPSLPVISSASERDTLIEFHRNVLNEVKNRIVIKGKPTAEILHFVQNDRGKVAFFSCHFRLFDTIIRVSQWNSFIPYRIKCCVAWMNYQTGCKKSPKDLYVNNPVQTKCSSGSKRNSGIRHHFPEELRSSSSHCSADVPSAILIVVQPTTGLSSRVAPQPWDALRLLRVIHVRLLRRP